VTSENIFRQKAFSSLLLYEISCFHGSECEECFLWDVRQCSLVECMISGYSREVDDNCTLLGCYASSGNLLLIFEDNLSVP
jgi:hypothetical protein